MECRICESESRLQLIFNAGKQNLVEMLTTVARVSISEDDHLPQYICSECKIQLIAAYKFKLQCERQDHALRLKLSITKRVVVTKMFIGSGKPEEPPEKRPKLDDLKAFRIEGPRSSELPGKVQQAPIEDNKGEACNKKPSPTQDNVDGGRFECLRCGLSFADVIALQKHFRSHILHYCKYCVETRDNVATQILENLSAERGITSIPIPPPPLAAAVPAAPSEKVKTTKSLLPINNRIITLPIKGPNNKSRFMETAELADVPVQVSEKGNTHIKTGVLKLLKCKICNFFFDHVGQFKAHCRTYHVLPNDKTTILQKAKKREFLRKVEGMLEASSIPTRPFELKETSRLEITPNDLSRTSSFNRCKVKSGASSYLAKEQENGIALPETEDHVDLTDPLAIEKEIVELRHGNIKRNKHQYYSECIDSDDGVWHVTPEEAEKINVHPELITIDLDSQNNFISSQSNERTDLSVNDRSSEIDCGLLSFDVNTIVLGGFSDYEN